MRANAASVGVAFDGDADRALFVDETGATVSGDHVMFAIGCDMHARGELAGDAIVGTVMSNIGFERALARAASVWCDAPVGDRYVLERMRAGGLRAGRRAIRAHHRFAPQYDRRRSDDGGDAVRHRRRRAGRTLHELVATSWSRRRYSSTCVRRDKDVLDVAEVREAIAAAEGDLARAGQAPDPASGNRAADPGHGRGGRPVSRSSGVAAGLPHGLRRRPGA